MNLLYRIKLAIVMCMGTAFFLSCESKDGEATPPGFPLEEKVVDSQAQEIVLKAKNNVEWFLTDFIIDGKAIRGDAWESEDIIYYSSRERDPINKYNHLLSIYKVEYEWFTWEKIDNTAIKIILTENNGDEQRTLNFTASVGNAQDNIKIVQKANN